MTIKHFMYNEETISSFFNFVTEMIGAGGSFGEFSYQEWDDDVERMWVDITHNEISIRVMIYRDEPKTRAKWCEDEIRVILTRKKTGEVLLDNDFQLRDSQKIINFLKNRLLAGGIKC